METEAGRKSFHAEFILTSDMLEDMEQHEVPYHVEVLAPWMQRIVFWGIPIAALALGVLGSAFWLWMLVDCLRSEHPGPHDKLLWTVVVIFMHVIGALLYFFIQKGDASPHAEKPSGQA